MPWPCFMVEYLGQSEPEPLEGGGTITHGLWRQDGQVVRFDGLRPGAMYLDDDQGLVVLLPCRSFWHPDRQDRTWTRTGVPPNVTVTPSVNAVGRYHGWLRDGVLTEDCEGRVFP